MTCGCNGFGPPGGGTPGAPSTVPTWFPCFAFTFADFTGFAALTGDVQIWAMPTRSVITGAVIKMKTAFAGAGVTALTFSVGIVGNLAKIISPHDALAAVTTTNFRASNILDLEDFGAAAVSIRLAAIAAGANLSNLTAGAGCVWFLGSQLTPP